MRRRTCRECHAPASYVEVTDHTLTHVDMKGRIARMPTTTSVYYCDEHTGITAA